MNLQELKKITARDESEKVEFKKSTGQRTTAMKTVCGMLNGSGGFVLFGVSDKGKILGQDVTAKTMAELNAELSRIDPPAFPDMETTLLDNGRTVISIRVPGGGGLYTYDGRAYLRKGPTTGLMPKAEYERRLMEYLHATRRWENEPAQGISIKDLDADEIQLTLSTAVDAGRMEQPRKTDTKSILTGLGLIVDGMLTNAAVVLYGRSARLESFYPQCLIQLARFRGTNRLADFSDNRQYWGHAFTLLRRAESFFKDHIPIAGKVFPDQFKRQDRPAYHPRAFREALANAFCHRDYAVPGASVSVAVYDDRMEVINPGDLHFGITPGALTRPHESKPWNPIIASVFYRAGLIEKWGTGTLNIIDWCRENGNSRPIWSVRAGSVVLTFKPLSEKSYRQTGSGAESGAESGVESGAEPGVESEMALQILKHLQVSELSKKEIALKIGKSKPTRYLNELMQSLLRKDIVEFTIPDKPNSRLQKYRMTQKGERVLDRDKMR